MPSKTFNVVLSMAMISTQLNAAPTYTDERKLIQVLRAENNIAIAAPDIDGTMRIVAENYVMTGGSSGIERTVAENRKGWIEEFATKGHDRYVRTMTKLEIGASKGILRAAELGRWEGINHREAGISKPFGSYFVHWSKVSGQWRVVLETYVTLGCRGPGCIPN